MTRLLVCVGAGGVGKTTIAAALALAAARSGQRAIVLTIDPARALARAMGLAEIASQGQRVTAAVSGVLSAAMLDQKQSWDAFVHRHAPSASVERALLDNSFYRRLSTSFAGSTEYMAIEEVCRLAESNQYDVIVLDTPPSAHALDFLDAPERIDRLLERDVSAWLAIGRGAWKSAGTVARFLLRRLERATGRDTLRDISAFFVALDALVDGVLARTRRARAMIRNDAELVLVMSPRQLVADESSVLAAKLRARVIMLAAIVINRVHPVPPTDEAVAERALAAGDPVTAWLRRAWRDALADARDERDVIARFVAGLPRVPIAHIPEADHDLHSLADLELVAGALSPLSVF